jgi:protein phosphatase
MEAQCRAQDSPKVVLENLLGVALGRAARDNVSAVVVRLLD